MDVTPTATKMDVLATFSHLLHIKMILKMVLYLFFMIKLAILDFLLSEEITATKKTNIPIGRDTPILLIKKRQIKPSKTELVIVLHFKMEGIFFDKD